MRRALILLSFIAACAPAREEPAPVVYQGTQPEAAPEPAPQPTATQPAAQTTIAAPVAGSTDTRGVRYYDGYQTIIARQGDSVDSMASRVGLSGAELAAYNGLLTSYQPEAGAELVLPARTDNYQTQVAQAAPAAATQPATQASEGGSGAGGWSASNVAAAIANAGASEEPAEEAPAVEPLLEPVEESEPEPVPQAVEVVEPEPEPEPAVIETAAVQPEPQSEPEPAATRLAPIETGARLLRPVDAPIARPFSKAPGPDRNDGVDFATAAGDPVRAADEGVVALVSKSLGGLGTIVLIRHANEYLTVYGRVDGVTVSKGDPVARGQLIAVTANLSAPRTPSLHFEVRRGAESVDPEDFL